MAIFVPKKGVQRLIETSNLKNFATKFLFLIQIFHLGDCKVWRQNGLYTIVELNFFYASKN